MDQSKKRRRSKSASDESKAVRPKRFLSTYNFFFKHERSMFVKSQAKKAKGGDKKPGKKLEFGSYSKEISKKWKLLSSGEKKVFEDMATKDLARYQRELDVYNKKMAEIEMRVQEEMEEEPVSSLCRVASKPKKEAIAVDETKSEYESFCSMKSSSSQIKPSTASVKSMPPRASGNAISSINPVKNIPFSKEFEPRCFRSSSQHTLVSPSMGPNHSVPKENISIAQAVTEHPTASEEIDAVSIKKKGKSPSIVDSMMLSDDANLCNMKRERKIGPYTFQTNRLYGRAKHVATMMNAYRRVNRRKVASEMILVSGYSGAGKSALVQQLGKPVMDMGGNFICGKFDHFRQMEPLSAIINAFTEFCNEAATKGAENLHKTRIAIEENVDSATAFLTNVIPGLRQIIQTPSSEPVNVGGMEAQSMLKYVFQVFVRAIATPDQPLVLFLDDLQWADPLSLDLIESLVTDSENESLLFIGSYRDNEITETHPLTSTLCSIESKHVQTTKIEVGDLSEADTNELISDMIQTDPLLTQSLSNVVYRKTSGNVLFVLQFLSSLCDEGFLSFSSETNRWQWDTATFESKKVADNTVELMLRKILQLPKETRSALMLVACLGHSCEDFVLSSMAAGDDIRHFGCVDLIASLELAVKEGLVDRVSSHYKFAHDQIRLAAYSLIPEDQRGNMHCWIGSQVWSNKSASPEKALFIVVGQLNKGASLMTDTNQRIQLAGLNLQAGQKSKSLAAFEPAAFYLNTGIGLLNESSWADHYDLCLQLYDTCAEAEYCIGNFDEMNNKLEVVFGNAKCLDDELDSFFTLISALLAQGRMHKALELGLEILSKLGESFPTFTDIKSIIMVEFAKTKQILQGKTDEELLTMKSMDDRHKIDAMKLMYVLGHTAFLAGSEFCPLIALRMMQASLNHGICDESAYAFAAFGFLMATFFRDVHGAHRFGKLALLLVDRTQAKARLPGVYGTVYTFIFPLFDHYRACLGPLYLAYKTGMRFGDVSFAMTAALQYCFLSFFCGEELATMENTLKKYGKKMMEHKQEQFCKFLLPYRQATLNLMGHSNDPENLNGEAMNQDQLLKEVIERKQFRVVAVIYHIRSWLAYLFGNYELASRMMDERQAIPLMCPPVFLSCSFLFIEGLISFSMFYRTGELKWGTLAQKSIDGLKEYAAHAPWNCQHKLLLLQAESASLSGEFDTASRKYKEAASTAGENGFIQDQALAYERTGIFYSKEGNAPIAAHYYDQAHGAYLKWGAKQKAVHLRIEYDF